MLRLPLADLSKELGGNAHLYCPDDLGTRGIEVCGVSIDSRQITPGAVFFALGGANHDGHDFVQDAARAGASVAVVARACDTTLPQVVVENTLEALASLARFWRDRMDVRTVAVTGSNGKTTVKNMLRAILRNSGKTLATRGNFNNEIGLPLTLLELEPQDQFLVVELGANHAGEIAHLGALARPEVGGDHTNCPRSLGRFWLNRWRR